MRMEAYEVARHVHSPQPSLQHVEVVDGDSNLEYCWLPLRHG